MSKKKIIVPDSTNVVIDPKLLDVVLTTPSGYPRELAAADTTENMRGMEGVRDFPSSYWIEPKDWKDRARQNDENKTWPDDFANRFTKQGNSHECTTHSLIQQLEIAINRAAGTKDYATWLAPLSVYIEANPSKWGGANIQTVLRIAIERGVLPSHNGPQGIGSQKNKFKVTLNESAGHNEAEFAGGPWVSLSKLPAGWENTARHFAPIECINCDSREEMISLILHGIAVGVGRNGHAVPITKAVWQANEEMPNGMYRDSYNRVLYDSWSTLKKGVGGSHGIVTVKVPDDWNAPAGADMK